ncbi:hypothetical protein HK102_011878, partial [Quaeritorhiza haematococci]
MKEKVLSFSGDDFKIKDASTGQVFFSIEGRMFGFGQKKTLLDYSGAPVASFKHQILTLLAKFDVYAGSDSSRHVLTVETKLTFLKSKLVTEFVNLVTGQRCRVVMKGNWRDKTAEVYLGEPKEGGRLIATLSRKLNAKHLFMGQQDYQVTIQPGVDSALIVLLALAFDESQNEKK